MAEVGRQPFVARVEEDSDVASHFSNAAVSSATFTEILLHNQTNARILELFPHHPTPIVGRPVVDHQ
jgi:hypothetical protein